MDWYRKSLTRPGEEEVNLSQHGMFGPQHNTKETLLHVLEMAFDLDEESTDYAYFLFELTALRDNEGYRTTKYEYYFK